MKPLRRLQCLMMRGTAVRFREEESNDYLWALQNLCPFNGDLDVVRKFIVNNGQFAFSGTEFSRLILAIKMSSDPLALTAEMQLLFEKCLRYCETWREIDMIVALSSAWELPEALQSQDLVDALAFEATTQLDWLRENNINFTLITLWQTGQLHGERATKLLGSFRNLAPLMPDKELVHLIDSFCKSPVAPDGSAPERDVQETVLVAFEIAASRSDDVSFREVLAFLARLEKMKLLSVFDERIADVARKYFAMLRSSNFFDEINREGISVAGHVAWKFGECEFAAEALQRLVDSISTGPKCQTLPRNEKLRVLELIPTMLFCMPKEQVKHHIGLVRDAIRHVFHCLSAASDKLIGEMLEFVVSNVQEEKAVRNYVHAAVGRADCFSNYVKTQTYINLSALLEKNSDFRTRETSDFLRDLFGRFCNPTDLRALQVPTLITLLTTLSKSRHKRKSDYAVVIKVIAGKQMQPWDALRVLRTITLRRVDVNDSLPVILSVLERGEFDTLRRGQALSHLMNIHHSPSPEAVSVLKTVRQLLPSEEECRALVGTAPTPGPFDVCYVINGVLSAAPFSPQSAMLANSDSFCSLFMGLKSNYAIGELSTALARSGLEGTKLEELLVMLWGKFLAVVERPWFELRLVFNVWHAMLELFPSFRAAVVNAALHIECSLAQLIASGQDVYINAFSQLAIWINVSNRNITDKCLLEKMVRRLRLGSIHRDVHDLPFAVAVASYLPADSVPGLVDHVLGALGSTALPSDTLMHMIYAAAHAPHCKRVVDQLLPKVELESMTAVGFTYAALIHKKFPELRGATAPLLDALPAGLEGRAPLLTLIADARKLQQ